MQTTASGDVYFCSLGLDHRLELHHPLIRGRKELLAEETDVYTVIDFEHFLSLSVQQVLHHAVQKALTLLMVCRVSSFSPFLLF